MTARICFLVFIGMILSLEAASQEKTLKRVDDPLAVEGKILGALTGTRPDRLSLMACASDGFQPVPFQIDEKNPAGDYVYTHGPKAGVDTDPNLNANDELVFMAESIGGRCDDRPWPEGARAGVRIEITDPVDRGRGWLYLFEFEGSPPRSPVDWVSREVGPDRVMMRGREYMWGSRAGRGFPDELHLAGADGKMGPDILDRWKSRGVIDLPLIKFETKTDDTIRRNTAGWIDGPVRAIVCDKTYMQISFIKYDLPSDTMLYYYPNCCFFPMTLSVQNTELMKLAAKIAKMNFVSVLDYNQNGYGIHSYDAVNPYNPEVVFDGKTSEAEKNLRTNVDLDWVVGYRPGIGGVMVRFYLPPEFQGITKGLYYLEDASHLDPPEDHPGLTAHGFQYSINLAAIEQGQHTLYSQYYFKPGLIPGQEKIILDIVDNPLQVKSAPLEKVTPPVE